MSNRRSKLFLSVIFFGLFGGLASCAYVPEKVEVAYQPIMREGAIAPIPVNVEVQVVDNRRDGKQVGCKKGEYGVELASIKLQGNLADEISKAIKMELQNLGFGMGPGNAAVEIEIQKFYNDFKPGFFKGRGVAELILSASLKKKTGEIVYSKMIIGMGENPSVWAHSGENAKVALDAALNDAIHKLVNDKAFLQALVK